MDNIVFHSLLKQINLVSLPLVEGNKVQTPSTETLRLSERPTANDDPRKRNTDDSAIANEGKKFSAKIQSLVPPSPLSIVHCQRHSS